MTTTKAISPELLEAVEELARQIAEATNKAYGSHFRQIVKVLPPEVPDLYAWLAALDDSAIEGLAQRLRAVEGSPRPHSPPPSKRVGLSSYSGGLSPRCPPRSPKRSAGRWNGMG